MLSRKINGSLSRLLIALFLLAGFSACGVDSPVMTANGMAAQTEFGADSPPLAPVENRAPQFHQVFADVAEKVIPTVVSIRSAKVVEVPEFNPWEWFFGDPRGEQQPRQPRQRRTEGVGSGVIVSSEGHILTNNHVVEGADDLTVTLSDKREFQAEIVGTDPPSDIAIIKLIDADNLPVAHLGDSDNLRIGEIVLAVGSPYQLSETVTMGIVSARGRSQTRITEYENFIQTDAAINPGNSGGPLVDMNGSVIGINTAIFSRTGGYQGIGFAIPINMAREIMRVLVSEGKVSRGWLGVQIRDIEGDLARALELEPDAGVLVDDVLPGTPAEDAGLEAGDVITHVAGDRVHSSLELRNKVAMIKPGTKTEFSVLRDGDRMSFDITLAERESGVAMAGSGTPDATKELTGLTVHNITTEMRRQYNLDRELQGVIIVEVDPTSPAARSGLREGYVIIEADREKVTSVSDFNRIVKNSGNDTILLRVRTDRGTSFVPLRLNRE